MEESEDRPATRKDLNELERGMREMEDRLIEHMRDMQTEIIRVFMAFQERNENRMATMETALPQRMANIERRLLEIEKKLLLEPPAA